VDAPRHFLSLLDFDPEELNRLVRRGTELKRLRQDGVIYEPLKNRTLAMIFSLSSTRTRVAFEAGMQQLGGHAIFLSPDDTQLGRGEPIEDTARVLSGMVDVVMIRTAEQADIEAFAEAASVPVINAMSSRYHPCQLLADVQTFVEHRGDIAGREVAFLGDGYNMCNSYINAARQFSFNLRIAAPEGYRPDPELVASSNNVRLVDCPEEAVGGADLVVTDVWSSMGHEADQAKRREAFAGYQVDTKMLDLARGDALLMHCLPAHRGEEVSAEVMDDPRSVVWDEAANRLHSQKALLEFLLVGNDRA
jgi:ornithine carbamoyltransferase